jgi:hypothetical protein
MGGVCSTQDKYYTLRFPAKFCTKSSRENTTWQTSVSMGEKYFTKYDVRMRTGFFWLSTGVCEHCDEYSGFVKGANIFIM